MFRFMLQEDVSKFDLSNIKTCCIAGEPLNPQVFNDWYKLTGLKLREGFGQTEGTVLIAMIGEGKTRGQSSILNIEATTNQNVAAIVIEHGYINPKFLWYWLQKEYKKNREKGAGSGPQALNCQRVRELGFIVPSIEEQNEIVNILERLLGNEEQVVSAIEGVIEQVADIKKSILAKAFRGELETNNPEEGSSIELLKKIITEN